MRRRRSTPHSEPANQTRISGFARLSKRLSGPLSDVRMLRLRVVELIVMMFPIDRAPTGEAVREPGL